MPDHDESAEVVRKKWNESFQRKLDEKPRQFAWQSEIVNRYMIANYLDGASVSMYLKRYLGDKVVKRGLEVGGGLGKQALQCYKMLNAEQFDVLDISDFSVAQGNAIAKEQGINVRYAVSDLNKDSLPTNQYDLIIASGSLHHIENLEHLFEQIGRALKPDGVFFANDYMGPTHMQWTDDQLAIMNQLLAVFPDEYAKVRHRDDQVGKEVTRIPLEIFARVDPSEGVRAAEIFGVMRDHLDIMDIVPIGNTINYEMLRGRIHNFDDADTKDAFILELLCTFEKILLDRGVISSDFNLVFAKQKTR